MKKKNVFLYFLLARDHEINVTENVLKKISSKNSKQKKCLRSLVYKDLLQDEHYLLYEKWQVAHFDGAKAIQDATLSFLRDELLEENILGATVWNKLYTTKDFDLIDESSEGVMSLTLVSLKVNAITELFKLFQVLVDHIHDYEGFLGCSLSIPNDGDLEKVMMRIIWQNAELRLKAVESPSFMKLKETLQKYITGTLNVMLFKEI